MWMLLPRILFRSGTSLVLTVLSLVLGALTLTTVLTTTSSVTSFFKSESQTLIGGDITIERDSPIDRSDPILQDLERTGAILSTRIETLIVGSTEVSRGENTLTSLLLSLKVVDAPYPLFGTVLLKDSTYTPLQSSEVLVYEDVLTRMGLMVGDTLSLGGNPFTIRGVIAREPDAVGSSFRLGPLALISSSGWERLDIDEEQSRIDYILSIRFPETLDPSTKSALSATLTETFTRPEYRVTNASNGPSSLLRTLESAKEFFFFMIVLSLFLAIVNIRLNLVYFLSSSKKMIAIMRSLGMQKRSLLALFSVLLMFLGMVAGTVGTLIGNALALLILPFIESIVGSTLPHFPLTTHIFPVLLFTILLCLFSSLGFLDRLLTIEPKILLLGYSSEVKKRFGFIRELPTALLSALSLYGGIYFFTGDALRAGIAVGVVAGLFAVLFLIGYSTIRALYRIRFRFSFILRSIVNFLNYQITLSATTIASLTVALTCIFSIALIEQNVLGNLETEFKEDAPNIYLIDIQADQLEGIRARMGTSWQDFSIVRGRFLYRDGYDIQANLNTEDGELRREFSLTSRSQLIDGETLTAGTWHGDTVPKAVSVERDFAERAKLTLGSTVTFFIQGVTVEATVTSIRDVVTTNGLPFFYIVFSPDLLSGIPSTSFGYAYVPKEDIPNIQNQIAIAYPNISSIPTTQIIETITKVVSVLAIAVVGTSTPALILGVLLIIAMLTISGRERSNDMLVFTVFGTQSKVLRKLFTFESIAIMLITSIIATALSYGIVFALNIFVFDFTGFYHAKENWYMSGALILLTFGIGSYFARSFVRQSPAKLLEKN